MTHSQKIFLRAAAVGLVECFLLAGLLLGIRHQTQVVNRIVGEVSDLRDPSPFRAALLGHLGKIHLSLKGFLLSPEPSLEKQADESRKDFEALLPEFARQNPKLFPRAAADEIKRSFSLFKESLDRTLEDNQQRLDRRALLNQKFARIFYLIDHNLRPIIRNDQADGEERKEAVLNIENQARAWQANLSQAWAQSTEAAKAIARENDSRGQSYLEHYASLELLSRERRIQKEIRTLWLANSDLARESFVKEILLSQAEKSMDGEREQVIAALNRFLPAMPPAELEAKKQAILRSIRLRLAGACVLGLLGLVSLIAAVLVIYRLLHRPAPVADGVYRAPSSGGRASADQSEPPTIEMDLKGTIAAWSPAAEKLYGYSASEMRGQSIGKLFESESEIGRLGQELQAAKQTTFETTHKTKAGASIPVRIEFRPVTDKAGQTTAIGLICTRR